MNRQGSLPAASLAEEVAEECSRLILEDTGGARVTMVEARISREIVEGAGSACFRIGGGVDEATYAGGLEGAGAHGAGFEGNV